MNRDEIVAHIEQQLGIAAEDLGDEGIVLFDGMEHAFLGVAERFEPVTEIRVGGADDGILSQRETGGEHRYFAVYSYDKMVEGLVADGMDYLDAVEYLEFNTVGLYAGPNTPAIMRDER